MDGCVPEGGCDIYPEHEHASVLLCMLQSRGKAHVKLSSSLYLYLQVGSSIPSPNLEQWNHFEHLRCNSFSSGTTKRAL